MARPDSMIELVDPKDQPPGIVSCRGCGDPILWYETARGRKMPVNADAAIVERDGALWVATSDTHWATCPERNTFKR